MAEPSTWIPDLPRGPRDAWQFDGELSTAPRYPMRWNTLNRERGLEGVSDGATKDPPSITLSGVTVAAPLRFSALNPAGPLAASRSRVQEQHAKLIALQNRRETGTLIIPGIDTFTSVVIGDISVTRNRATRRLDYSVTFQKINVVSLLLTPAVADFDAQVLGPAGFEDQGDLT